MGTDFMAAVLRAVVEPDISRGEALTRLWTTRFGLADLDNAPGSAPGGPLVLYNSTEVDSGSRYVIGLPRLPHGLFGDAVGAMDDEQGKEWVTGGQAARLSANFPWGFDVVHVPGGSPADAVDLLDGGIVDNTGIDTLAELFGRLSLTAGEGSSGSPDAEPQAALAQQLLDVLRTRGVLLVEIDAGARPADSASGLLPGFTRPLQALSAAGSNNANAARDENVDRIRRVLDVPEMPGRFLHLAWICNRIDNVQTAWSLGTRDEAVTTLQFLAEQHRLAPALARLGSTFDGTDDEAAVQRSMDEQNMRAREVQVESASAGEVPEKQKVQAAVSVEEVAKVGVTHTTKPKPSAAYRPPPGAAVTALLADGAPLLTNVKAMTVEDAQKVVAQAQAALDSAKAAAKQAQVMGKDAKKVVGDVQAIVADPTKALQDPSKVTDAAKAAKDAVTRGAKTAGDAKKTTDTLTDAAKKLLPADPKDTKDKPKK